MKVVLRSKSDYRQTISRNLLTSLIHFEAIKTTKNQAKQLVMFANRFFNRVKTNDLTGKRLAGQTLFSALATKKVFEELLPRYQAGTTTYVRSLSLGRRLGDNAALALVSFLPASAKIDSSATSKSKTKLTKKSPSKSKSRPKTKNDA